MTITMPAVKWEALLDSLEPAQRAAVLESIDKPKVNVSKTAVRKAIGDGIRVPGADLIVAKKTLVRR